MDENNELDYDEFEQAYKAMEDFLKRADILLELELSQDQRRMALVVYFSKPHPSLYCFLKDPHRPQPLPLLTRRRTAEWTAQA